MRAIRKLLYPFSLIYGLITSLRNLAYDKGWLTSTEFDTPIIAVGNLSVGGTGKTPMIEYLVRLFHGSLRMAVLSRGYGRKTKGYILADKQSTSIQIGDESLQFFRKFDQLTVAVDENRVNGVEHLLKLTEAPDLILLDDAYQHRKIKAGLYILMTSFDKLYCNDLVLPAGDLREPSVGAKRADLIVVSKCPEDLSKQGMERIIKDLKILPGQEVFFTTIEYSEKIYGSRNTLSLAALASMNVLLVTGIAKPKPLEEFLEKCGVEYRHLEFPDHHDISDKDLDRIRDEVKSLDHENSVVLTTEKDYVRSFIDSELPIYYLPIRMIFLEREEKFMKLINDYVRKN